MSDLSEAKAYSDDCREWDLRKDHAKWLDKLSSAVECIVMELDHKDLRIRMLERIVNGLCRQVDQKPDEEEPTP